MARYPGQSAAVSHTALASGQSGKRVAPAQFPFVWSWAGCQDKEGRPATYPAVRDGMLQHPGLFISRPFQRPDRLGPSSWQTQRSVKKRPGGHVHLLESGFF